MASAVTSIYEYPISAAIAAYAPTNTAEVTAMIDSAVSGKLDASASSAFQPSGNYQTAGDYVSSSELANYQTTAGMSAYATTAALADKLDSSASSSFMPASASGDYMPASSSADFQTTAGMSAYQTVDGMSAYQSAGDYATTADLSAKLDASAEVVTSIGTTELPGISTFVTSINGNPVSSDISDRANKDMSGRDLTSLAASSSLADYQTTAGMSGYATTGDLSAKLDASASSAFITSTAGLVSTGDLENYQTTAAMSGYATTGDLSAKLDASASSAFLTSQVQASWSETSSSSPAYIVDRPTEGTLSAGDYMDISVSGNVVTLGVTGVATTADLSAKLDASASSAFITSTAGLVSTGDLSAYLETSAIETSTAGVTGIAGTAIAGGGGGTTYTAGQYIQISGDEISVTGIYPNSYATTGDLSAKLDASASSTFITSTAGLATTGDLENYQTTAGMSGYATTGDLADYQTTAGMSGYATTADLSAKLDASASSAFLTAQEQASWSETASSSPSYIVDKPDLVDIVAGPGIVVDNPDGNTLRVSMAADYENVLWDCNGTPLSNTNATATLSEVASNFQYIRFYWMGEQAATSSAAGLYGIKQSTFDMTILETTGFSIGGLAEYYSDGAISLAYGHLTLNEAKTIVTLARQTRYNIKNSGVTDYSTGNGMFKLYRVVGINRISGGN